MNKKKSISYYSLEKTKTVCNTLYGLKISTNHKLQLPLIILRTSALLAEPVNRFPTQNSNANLSARSHVLQTSLLSHQKQPTTKPSISLHENPPSTRKLILPLFSLPSNPHRCESLQMKTRI